MDKEDTKKGSITSFIFGHEKLDKADIIQLAILALFVVYMVFYLLKSEDII